MTSTGVPAVLARVTDETVDVGVVVDDAFEVTVAFVGLLPVAVAVLFTAPASTSAWVIA